MRVSNARKILFSSASAPDSPKPGSRVRRRTADELPGENATESETIISQSIHFSIHFSIHYSFSCTPIMIQRYEYPRKTDLLQLILTKLVKMVKSWLIVALNY